MIWMTTISIVPAIAQGLTSTSYKIINPTVDSGGGIATSNGYSLFAALGNSGMGIRFNSANYQLAASAPSQFQANIPLVSCFETISTVGNTLCTNVPGSVGMIDICGEPGCYDRAKLEIDNQSNPVDTLYLVSISTDNFVNDIFFLQTDHTLSRTFNTSSYMTICQIEGIDMNDVNCNNSGAANWNASLQNYNILGLAANTTYYVAVRALHGNFTETNYSPTITTTTTMPSIGFDLDISSTNSETSGPYTMNLGVLSMTTPKTSNKGIWVDISTNDTTGVDIKISSTSSGLYSISNNSYILSENEDLDLPNGNGGYGAKLASVSQSSLGPLQTGSTYDTSGTNIVGAITNIPGTVAYTDKLGTHYGQITNGRIRLNLKAKAYIGLPSGSYSNSIFFTAITR